MVVQTAVRCLYTACALSAMRRGWNPIDLITCRAPQNESEMLNNRGATVVKEVGALVVQTAVRCQAARKAFALRQVSYLWGVWV